MPTLYYLLGIVLAYTTWDPSPHTQEPKIQFNRLAVSLLWPLYTVALLYYHREEVGESISILLDRFNLEDLPPLSLWWEDEAEEDSIEEADPGETFD